MTTMNPSSIQKPAIVAPVMRFLRVIDTDRSVAFYRDVLGFDVRPVLQDYGFPAVAEVVSGEARIQIGNKEPVQRQIVFFATDNVGAMPEALGSVSSSSDVKTVFNCRKVYTLAGRDLA